MEKKSLLRMYNKKLLVHTEFFGIMAPTKDTISIVGITPHP